MITRYPNHDSSVIQIIIQRVPTTRTLDQVSSALANLDTSIHTITDAAIETALDTSSIQALWAEYNQFDIITAQALTDLDDRVTTLDASLRSLTIDDISTLSDGLTALESKTDDISTRLA